MFAQRAEEGDGKMTEEARSSVSEENAAEIGSDEEIEREAEEIVEDTEEITAEAEEREKQKDEKVSDERAAERKEGREENPMRRVEIDKVVINIGVGQSGEKLKNAEKILERITGQKPVETLARRTIQPFGIKRGEPIGCKVTLRKERAVKFLREVFKIQNRIYESQFDNFGNLSFGIEEHTDLGIPYDPAVGILGMDVSVSLKRAGFRIKYRRIQRRKLPRKHMITREEGIAFFMREFGVKVIEE